MQIQNGDHRLLKEKPREFSICLMSNFILIKSLAINYFSEFHNALELGQAFCWNGHLWLSDLWPCVLRESPRLRNTEIHKNKIVKYFSLNYKISL